MSLAKLAESYRVYRDSIKTKRIETCANLYDSPITVDVEYVDTVGQPSEYQARIPENAKVMLCLHGAPGDHGTWRHQVKHFAEKGYRVIAPNFPDYSLTTKTGKFHHSARERTQYIIDFLVSLTIKRIDILMVHSAGFFTAAMLTNNDQFTISKLILLNPGVTYTLLKSPLVKYFAFNFRVFNAVYKNQRMRSFMEPVIKSMVSVGSNLSHFVLNDHNNVLLQASISSYTNVDELVSAIDGLKEKLDNNNVKLLLVFSEKDELIPKDKFYSLVRKLGGSDENVEIYDIDDEIEKCRRKTSQPWVTVFRVGSHNFFMKNAVTVNTVISKFIMSNN